MSLFNKNLVVGVSVSPERGLEVAQIDFATRTVLKYGSRPLAYNSKTRKLADLDIFKEELRDLLLDLGIPQGTGIVLNMPTVAMKITDYPAALPEEQITVAIEEDLYENEYYKEQDPAFSAVLLPNSSMQVNKVAYTSLPKATVIEIVIIIKDLGYKLIGIDTSSNSTFNSLVYLDRVNIEGGIPWVLLLVENDACRIIPMLGNVYSDVMEEKISIGEVLTDAENYSIVISAVESILKNFPSKYLCVVSKTNVISAEVLANKLSYSAPITYQEANDFLKEPIIRTGPLVDPGVANKISLDVIGAAIYSNYINYAPFSFNLFNKSLGEVFLVDQPPELVLGKNVIVLSIGFLAKAFITLLILLVVPSVLWIMSLNRTITELKDESASLQSNIDQINKFLKDNENISTNIFDEGEQISMGLERNKNVYSYYTIVGTEIPKKLWLTRLDFGDKITIEGQADNLESVYSFFRAIKDYNPNSDIKLQKLGLATAPKNNLSGETFDTESILSSLEADFYEFRISNDEADAQNKVQNAKNAGNANSLPPLESIR